MPADLVDEVRVDVGDMKIGDVIRVKDLPIYADKKITIMTDPDAVVVALNAAHNAAVPETETGQKLKKSQRRTNNLEKIISEQLNDSKKGMVTKMTIPFLHKKI